MENVEKKKKIKKKKPKMLDIPVLEIADNIVFSKKEVWAYYKISTVPFDFLSSSAKANLANKTVSSLNSLLQSEGKKVDGHILITSSPFDIKSWESQLDENYIRLNKEFTAPYDRFMTQQMRELAYNNYQRPVVYLGVKLFNRGAIDLDNFNVFEFGFSEAFETFKKGVKQVFDLPGEEIKQYEYERAVNMETDTNRIMTNGFFRGVKPTAEELLLTIKRQYYPSMTTPYLEVDHGNRVGLSDIMIETGGVIENTSRFLRFEQFINGEIQEGYRATLSFTRFPSDMAMPGNQVPFLYMPAYKRLPYTLSARFTMIPHSEVKRDLEKKKLETKDEVKNLANSGQGSNASIQETLYDLGDLEVQLEQDKTPWLSGSYRLTIEMPTEYLLKEAIGDIKQSYKDEKTELKWTTGDQLDLFLEEMIGSNLKMTSFNQMTSLSMLGVSGFNIGGSGGDPVKERLLTTGRG